MLLRTNLKALVALTMVFASVGAAWKMPKASFLCSRMMSSARCSSVNLSGWSARLRARVVFRRVSVASSSSS